MRLKKIVNNLQGILLKDKSEPQRKYEATAKLVSKLQKKKQKLTAKLERAQSHEEIKKVERHLKVCNAHLEKGQAALKEMEKELS